MGKGFVHLHVHTEYSLLDGSGKILEMLNRAKELGMNSLAITDHGTMYGCVEFYKKAKEIGIKPIIGCEIYVAGKSMYIRGNDPQNETYHLVLLVKNEEGYNNLMKIVSAASIDGFYYKPRVDHEFLKNHSNGLIALSACLGGEVQSHILKDQIQKAKEAALIYNEIFKEGFYLELQDHNINEQIKVNKILIELSKELNIPLVATNDVHYINKEDSKAHDILLCIQTGKTVDEENRMRYPSMEFYLKSPTEMENSFSYVQEALDNTVKISEMCNFDYQFHVSKLPDFPLPEGIDHYQYLKQLCLDGLKSKYENISEKLYTRLNYELSIIKQMGYVDYFLIVWDFILFANQNGIMTGPGRGSAAGSIVAFCLGITKIDPIRYNLIFERFLNPERISMPDIDSDFCYERRGEVIDYVVKKYGKDNVSQIITFGTMAPRACIRDVGRAMNYPYAEVDKIAKMIPAMLNITIDKALEINSELKNYYDEDVRVKELVDIAKSLEGIPRHSSTHAAGVVIASKPIVNYVPLQKNEGMIVTQFTMGTLEELGLLKMDFLGLRTLTVIRDTISMVKENRGINIDIDQIDFNDAQVYKMIGDGNTVGVFQLESAGMTNFMKELKPDNLEDIIAGISLYRPGPMSEIPTYIHNKNHPLDIKYEVPQLQPILKVTYGCMVYQEQVMQIVRDLAGYTMGRSDLVRRAMSKKKYKVMEEERNHFIYGIHNDDGTTEVLGCVSNGISAESANKLFDLMMDFASYAFNKSHAAAYAVVGYQTAYLMKYYPAEYIAAMLNSIMGDNEKVAYYIKYAKKIGVEVLPPDINESYGRFTVKDETIRFGLAAIKNVGINVINSIVISRNSKGKFTDLADFAEKVDFTVVNKRAVESLIKSGAFDPFRIYRSKLLSAYEKVIDNVLSQKKKKIKGQVSLFDFQIDGNTNIEIPYPDIKEFQSKYLLAMEKEMTGLYISGHPLDEYEDILNLKTNTKILDIIGMESLEESNPSEFRVNDGDTVVVGGIINEFKKKITKNNNMMAFAKIEDLTSSIEVVIFPKIYEKYNKILFEDALLIIKGRVNIKEEESPKIICEEITSLVKEMSNKLYIQIDSEEGLRKIITKFKNETLKYSGEVPVYFFTKKEKKKYTIGKENYVSISDELIDYLEKTFGKENIKIV